MDSTQNKSVKKIQNWFHDKKLSRNLFNTVNNILSSTSTISTSPASSPSQFLERISHTLTVYHSSKSFDECQSYLYSETWLKNLKLLFQFIPTYYIDSPLNVINKHGPGQNHHNDGKNSIKIVNLIEKISISLMINKFPSEFFNSTKLKGAELNAFNSSKLFSKSFFLYINFLKNEKIKDIKLFREKYEKLLFDLMSSLLLFSYFYNVWKKIDSENILEQLFITYRELYKTSITSKANLLTLLPLPSSPSSSSVTPSFLSSPEIKQLVESYCLSEIQLVRITNMMKQVTDSFHLVEERIKKEKKEIEDQITEYVKEMREVNMKEFLAHYFPSTNKLNSRSSSPNQTPRSRSSSSVSSNSVPSSPPTTRSRTNSNSSVPPPPPTSSSTNPSFTSSSPPNRINIEKKILGYLSILSHYLSMNPSQIAYEVSLNPKYQVPEEKEEELLLAQSIIQRKRKEYRDRLIKLYENTREEEVNDDKVDISNHLEQIESEIIASPPNLSNNVAASTSPAISPLPSPPSSSSSSIKEEDLALRLRDDVLTLMSDQLLNSLRASNYDGSSTTLTPGMIVPVVYYPPLMKYLNKEEVEEGEEKEDNNKNIEEMAASFLFSSIISSSQFANLTDISKLPVLSAKIIKVSAPSINSLSLESPSTFNSSSMSLSSLVESSPFSTSIIENQINRKVELQEVEIIFVADPGRPVLIPSTLIKISVNNSEDNSLKNSPSSKLNSSLQHFPPSTISFLVTQFYSLINSFSILTPSRKDLPSSLLNNFSNLLSPIIHNYSNKILNILRDLLPLLRNLVSYFSQLQSEYEAKITSKWMKQYEDILLIYERFLFYNFVKNNFLHKLNSEREDQAIDQNDHYTESNIKFLVKYNELIADSEKYQEERRRELEGKNNENEEDETEKEYDTSTQIYNDLISKEKKLNLSTSLTYLNKENFDGLNELILDTLKIILRSPIYDEISRRTIDLSGQNFTFKPSNSSDLFFPTLFLNNYNDYEVNFLLPFLPYFFENILNKITQTQKQIVNFYLKSFSHIIHQGNKETKFKLKSNYIKYFIQKHFYLNFFQLNLRDDQNPVDIEEKIKENDEIKQDEEIVEDDYNLLITSKGKVVEDSPLPPQYFYTKLLNTSYFLNKSLYKKDILVDFNEAFNLYYQTNFDQNLFNQFYLEDENIEALEKKKISNYREFYIKYMTINSFIQFFQFFKFPIDSSQLLRQGDIEKVISHSTSSPSTSLTLPPSSPASLSTIFNISELESETYREILPEVFIYDIERLKEVQLLYYKTLYFFLFSLIAKQICTVYKLNYKEHETFFVSRIHFLLSSITSLSFSSPDSTLGLSKEEFTSLNVEISNFINRIIIFNKENQIEPGKYENLNNISMTTLIKSENTNKNIYREILKLSTIIFNPSNSLFALINKRINFIIMLNLLNFNAKTIGSYLVKYNFFYNYNPHSVSSPPSMLSKDKPFSNSLSRSLASVKNTSLTTSSSDIITNSEYLLNKLITKFKQLFNNNYKNFNNFYSFIILNK